MQRFFYLDFAMNRSFRLVLLQNKQSLLRLRYDLGRELVVIISSAVLLGLFAYIFHDFLTEKLAVIPDEQRLRISSGFAAILLLILGPWLGSLLDRLWRQDPSLAAFARRSGENPQTIGRYLGLQTLVILVLGYGLYWMSVGRLWANWTLVNTVLLQVFSLVFAAVRFRFGSRSQSDREMKPILSEGNQDRKKTLVAWRWHQMIQRNRLARACLLAALLLQIVTGVLLYLGAPFPLAVLLSMVVGLLASCAPAFQLEEDMRAIWFERQMGCSHEEYVAVYQRLCLILSTSLTLSMSLLFLCSASLPRIPWHEGLKLGVISGLFPALLPAIMFQLAPERPILQLMIIGLVGLFLGTAVFAHWGFFALIPIALTYAKQYQQNNFYRS